MHKFVIFLFVLFKKNLKNMKDCSGFYYHLAPSEEALTLNANIQCLVKLQNVAVRIVKKWYSVYFLRSKNCLTCIMYSLKFSFHLFFSKGLFPVVSL